MDSNRSEQMEKIQEIYGGIGPVLTKLESIVLKTNTGKCAEMVPYYEHWENKIFVTLIRSVNKNKV